MFTIFHHSGISYDDDDDDDDDNDDDDSIKYSSHVLVGTFWLKLLVLII